MTALAFWILDNHEFKVCVLHCRKHFELTIKTLYPFPPFISLSSHIKHAGKEQDSASRTWFLLFTLLVPKKSNVCRSKWPATRILARSNDVFVRSKYLYILLENSLVWGHSLYNGLNLEINLNTHENMTCSCKQSTDSLAVDEPSPFCQPCDYDNRLPRRNPCDLKSIWRSIFVLYAESIFLSAQHSLMDFHTIKSPLISLLAWQHRIKSDMKFSSKVQTWKNGRCPLRWEVDRSNPKFGRTLTGRYFEPCNSVFISARITCLRCIEAFRHLS